MAALSDAEIITRLADLETQLAFQEDTIESLNQALAKQNDELSLLQHRMRVLVEKFQQLNDQGDIDNNDASADVPPHY